jgi:hypothetical protein
MVGSMPFVSQQLTIVGRNGMLHYALLEYIIANEVYIYAWHLDIRVQRAG